MKRRFFISDSILIAAIWLVAACAAMAAERPEKPDAAPKKTEQPNILFILIDDMGWHDPGFMGQTYYETPNIDKLAAEGMIFTQAYSNAANCAPTRASLISGQYTPRHGVFTVGNSDRGPARQRRLVPIDNNNTLAPEQVTFAEVLTANGYTCGCIGKWHVGDTEQTSPTGQGFASYKSRADYPPFTQTGDPKNIYAFTDDAVGFIEANQDKPFMLYLSHDAVHSPTQSRPALENKYQVKDPTADPPHANYAGMIESLDRTIGQLMQKLDELKLRDRTVVFFFSDNGGFPVYTSCEPLRGSKGMYYEGGIRVPMAVRWPGVIRSGSTCAVPVISTDFYPTFLEVAGLKKPADKTLDGVSLLPLFGGGTTLDRDALYWHFPGYLQPYAANMTDARDKNFRSRPVSVIRKGKWKLLQYFEEWTLDGGWDTIDRNNAIELYDLEKDPYETTNVARDHKNIRDELLTQLTLWQKSTGAPIPTKANPNYRP